MHTYLPTEMQHIQHSCILACIQSRLPNCVPQSHGSLLRFSGRYTRIYINAYTTQVVVATALVTLGLCTAALGLTLILLGKRKLARLVSYLPLPVSAYTCA